MTRDASVVLADWLAYGTLLRLGWPVAALVLERERLLAERTALLARIAEQTAALR